MDKNEKDKLKRYGKLFCDFANAEKTDYILISFFENLQTAFNFSKNFTKKALAKFPTKKKITDHLTNKEIELLEILMHRNKILKSCNDLLSHVYSDIEKYDPVKEAFTIIARIYFEGIPDINSEHNETPHLIPKNKIEEFIRDKTESYYDNYLDKDIFTDKVKEMLEGLAAICHSIEEIRQEATNRFTELEKMAETYLEVCELHNEVKKTQENIKNFLLEITQAGNAFETKGFENILLQYNKIQKTKYIVNNKYELIEIPPFIEDSFLDDNFRLDDKQIFNEPISYCLVEFLKNPEYSGGKRIAICRRCNGFFSKNKLYDRQLSCSDKCRLDYHNEIDISSGKRAAYKRKKRKEGAKESYYG